MPVLHRDLESRSEINLKAAGAWRYAAGATTEVLCVAYAVDDAPVQLWIPGQPIPKEFVEAAQDPSWHVSAHSDAFESAIEELVLAPRFGWPLVPPERHRCTAAMCCANALPRELEKVAEVLRLPHQKDKAGKRLIRKMVRGKKLTEEELAQLYDYCRQDVEVERALHKSLPALSSAEQGLWVLDQIINRRGFYTDGPLLDAAQKLAAAAELRQQAEFRAITGLNSTNQVARFIDWLAEHDCVVGDATKATLSHALRRSNLAPEVRVAITLRQQLAHASAGKIEALLAYRGDDGRVRGTLRYHGAGTGRWTGSGPQPQNFKRDGENIAGKVEAVMNGGAGLQSPVEAVGDIARAMICAAPGHRLLVADFSGIESRVLAWISIQQSKINAWAQFDRTGQAEDDPYVRLAQRCGLTGEGARDIGKRIDLSFGFGGSVGAWQRLAPEDDTTAEATAKRYRDTWRAEHPKTVAFWYALDRAATGAVKNPGRAFLVGRVSYRYDEPFLKLTLPSGRAISYPFARINGADKFGRLQLTFLDNAGGKFTECRFGQGCWFGLLVENVVQAIARDLLAAALLRLEAAGYPVILHVHDEIVCEAPIGFGSLEEFQQIVTAVPVWAEGLPVAVKARNGARFAKSAPEQEAPPWESKAPEPDPQPEPEPRPQPKPEPEPEPRTAPNGGGYQYSEPNAGKPYAPTRKRLLMQGYEIARTFSYELPGGKTLYSEDRYELKPGIAPTEARPRKTSRFWHEVNGQAYNNTGPRRILFNWQMILGADHEAPIHITEGANKSLALIERGFIATAVAYHNWAPECIDALRGRHLIYHEDHDPPDKDGKKPSERFSADARRKLSPAAASFRIVPAAQLWKHLPPGARAIRPHDDVKDWLGLGGDPARLIEICQEIPADSVGAEPIIKTSAEFVRGFVPPDYTVVGILQRRFLYSLTGQTGAGKTAITLRLAASAALKISFGGHQTKQTRVLYAAAENPDDVRMRWIALATEMGFDINTVGVFFTEGRFTLSTMLGKLGAEAERHGGDFGLVVIDTSPAFFEGDDENSRAQMGEHARRLRQLITIIPGGPTILANCHPVKNATVENLLPAGGGTFLNEVDGNLTCAKNDSVAELHWQGKFRGPEFAPMAFLIKTVTHPELKDSDDRLMPTVICEHLSEQGQADLEKETRNEEDAILELVKQQPTISLSQMATQMGWYTHDDKPNRSRVQRRIKMLIKDKLIKKNRDVWEIVKQKEKAR
jgi:DNA polymerase